MHVIIMECFAVVGSVVVPFSLYFPAYILTLYSQTKSKRIKEQEGNQQRKWKGNQASNSSTKVDENDRIECNQIKISTAKRENKENRERQGKGKNKKYNNLRCHWQQFYKHKNKNNQENWSFITNRPHKVEK